MHFEREMEELGGVIAFEGDDVKQVIAFLVNSWKTFGGENATLTIAENREGANWVEVVSYPASLLADNLNLANKLHIGRQIAGARDALGISVRDLEELSGCASSNITKIELGRYNASMDIIYKICRGLGLEMTLV